MERFEKNNRIVIALNAVYGSDVFTSEKNGPYDTPIIKFMVDGEVERVWFPWKYVKTGPNSARTITTLVHEVMADFKDNFKGKDVTELLKIARKLDK